MRWAWIALVSLLVEGAAEGKPKEKPRPFTVDDLVAMERISGVKVSPDGKRVVFVVRTTDLEANRGRTDLWLVNVDGTGLKQLTTDPENDADPWWAPDGKSIYFLSSRDDDVEVWRVAVDGGEAKRVTELPLEVDAFAVTPDGERLIVAMDVFPDCGTLECTTKRLEEVGKRKATGRVYTKLFVRHWDKWEDGRRLHLHVVPIAGGTPVDLMKGMDADTPSLPFGDISEIDFTSDGKQIVFDAKDVGREEAWSTNFDLFVVPIDGSARPKKLTTTFPGQDLHPRFSPDGKTLAWLSMARAGYESDRQRIMVMPWPGGTAREVAPEWDRSPEEIVWSADGKTIYATASHVGQYALFAIDVATGKASELHGEGTVSEVNVAAGGTLVFGLDHLRSPVELFTLAPDARAPKQITRINEARVAAIQMGEPEQFSFQGAGGDTVYGWIVRPAGHDRKSKQKVPVAFLIHGGPQGSFGNHFHYRWNPQAYAGRGYAAVMIDFHGSTGYGQAFTDSIGGDWGGKPLEDLQKGLAAALEKYPFLDGDRVCALGASFGGYMIAWIAGKWPDRFRCLVDHDGNLDERAAYFGTEELWFPEWDHRGTPWDNPEGYAKHNPVDHVKNWKTPILVIHGAKDFRVVETQGLSTFNAAQRLGVPSELLYFPDENHWVLKPHNSILWHQTVLGWLDRWTAKKK